MNHAEEPSSERCRELAERLRELAEQSPLPEIQADLISLAAYFDDMAVYLETRRRSGRVGMWRGGGRPGMSVSASFVWRCLSGSAIAPFPHPSHRTQRA